MLCLFSSGSEEYTTIQTSSSFTDQISTLLQSTEFHSNDYSLHSSRPTKSSSSQLSKSRETAATAITEMDNKTASDFITESTLKHKKETINLTAVYISVGIIGSVLFVLFLFFGIRFLRNRSHSFESIKSTDVSETNSPSSKESDSYLSSQSLYDSTESFHGEMVPNTIYELSEANISDKNKKSTNSTQRSLSLSSETMHNFSKSTECEMITNDLYMSAGELRNLDIKAERSTTEQANGLPLQCITEFNASTTVDTFGVDAQKSAKNIGSDVPLEPENVHESSGSATRKMVDNNIYMSADAVEKTICQEDADNEPIEHMSPELVDNIIYKSFDG